MKSIYKSIKSEYASGTCYPPANLIFNAFACTSFDDIKVVIVGQDPYIKPDEAMGLCFSVPKKIKCPPSLTNMYKALENDSRIKFKMPNPKHGDISSWAKQGVLMLNVTMTVQHGKSNSHAKLGWSDFT